MPKVTRLYLLLLGLLLLLLASLAQAARPEPSDSKPTGDQQLPKGAAAEGQHSEVAAPEGCGDECMMRRTAEDHLDYIYTQDKKN